MCDICLGTAVGRHSMVRATDDALAATVAAPERAAATPTEALRMLIEGNVRYVANEPRERDFSAGRASRAVGQAPFAAILGCADSRVSPELAFDQGPGELFVVRLAGNFVTEEGLASLEFGAAVLGTKVIVVLGHSSCGAINATIAAIQNGNDLPGHIKDLVDTMSPAIAPVVSVPGDDLADRAVIANVRHNVERLRAATPILSDLVATGALIIVGAVYDLPTGTINLV